jgi:hypothetical protein
MFPGMDVKPSRCMLTLCAPSRPRDGFAFYEPVRLAAILVSPHPPTPRI